MKRDTTKPEEKASGFNVPLSKKAALKKAAKDATGSVNARIEAKLDYIIAKLEEGE